MHIGNTGSRAARSARPGGGRLRRARRLAFPVLALAVALTAGACSSSSHGAGAAPAGSAGAAAPTSAPHVTGSAAPASDVGITPTTIRIGVIADVDTSVAPGLFKKNVNLVKAWAADVNASGGLAGRKVVVDFCDGKQDPNDASTCVIKECAQDFALVGTAALGLAGPSDIDGCKNSDGKAIGIPNLDAITQTASVQCDPDTFMLTGNDPTLCKTIKDNPQTYTVPVGDDRWLKSKFPGLHGIFVYNTDDPTARLNELPVYTADAKMAKIKLDGAGYYGASCTQPQSALIPTVLIMKQHGATFAQDGSCPANFEQLQAEAKLQGVTGVKAWVCAGNCYAPYYIALNPSVVEGTYQTLTTIPFYTEYKDNPTLAKLVKQIGGVNNMDANSLPSYAEALLFQDAVNKAIANGGTLTRQSLFTALRTKETSFNADGIIGTTDVSTHSLSACFDVVQVIKGQWQRVYPTKPASFDCNPANLVQVKLNLSTSA